MTAPQTQRGLGVWKMSEMSELKLGFHQPDRCGPWFVVGRYPPPDHSVSLFEWHWDWKYCRTIWSRGGFLFRGYLYGFDGGIKFPYRRSSGERVLADFWASGKALDVERLKVVVAERIKAEGGDDESNDPKDAAPTQAG